MVLERGGGKLRPGLGRRLSGRGTFFFLTIWAVEFFFLIYLLPFPLGFFFYFPYDP